METDKVLRKGISSKWNSQEKTKKEISIAKLVKKKKQTQNTIYIVFKNKQKKSSQIFSF
jgi:hypothetical protein